MHDAFSLLAVPLVMRSMHLRTNRSTRYMNELISLVSAASAIDNPECKSQCVHDGQAER